MKVYWTMKNGQQIDVDKMDINHLRNTLKMIMRNLETLKQKQKAKPKFEIHGDIAQSMIDQCYLQDYEYELGINDLDY